MGNEGYTPVKSFNHSTYRSKLLTKFQSKNIIRRWGIGLDGQVGAGADPREVVEIYASL